MKVFNSMKEQLQIDFDNIIKTSSFTKRDIELKQNSLNEFIKTGFPNRRQENWKFSDLNQIIKKNIGDLSFYNDYSLSNKIDTSVFIDGLEHNKIVFINEVGYIGDSCIFFWPIVESLVLLFPDCMSSTIFELFRPRKIRDIVLI